VNKENALKCSTYFVLDTKFAPLTAGITLFRHSNQALRFNQVRCRRVIKKLKTPTKVSKAWNSKI